MKEIAVVGVGITNWGRRQDVSYTELLVESAKKVFDDVRNLDSEDVDAFYLATAQPERFVEQAHPANLATEQLGIRPRLASRMEMACASGGAALRTAFLAIASGLADVALVCGVEKMLTVPTATALRNLCLVPDTTWESFHGMTAPAGFGLVATRYMHEYGLTQEQMAKVAVKNHHNASMNPVAHFRNPITVQDVLNSPTIAWPLHLYDCSPLTDGSAAAILCSADRAKTYNDTPIAVLGSAQRVEAAFTVSNLGSITTWRPLRDAAAEAYAMAKVGPEQVNVAEVHDCFTIAEIIEYEDLGFCQKGEGGKLVDAGDTQLGGKIPVNPSGGLKAKGHPLGATGVAQVVEIVEQLRGEADRRQVEGAEIGLTHNLSGFATHHVVHILRRMD